MEMSLKKLVKNVCILNEKRTHFLFPWEAKEPKRVLRNLWSRFVVKKWR